MDHVGRARLAETCGSRDESPSSNLGRVKQGEAIRVDDMDPQGQRDTEKWVARMRAYTFLRDSRRTRSSKGFSQEGDGDADALVECFGGIATQRPKQDVHRKCTEGTT